MNFCGKFTTMGHGDNAECGRDYWGKVYQCDQCKIKDLQEEVRQLRKKTSWHCPNHPDARVLWGDGDRSPYCELCGMEARD